MLHTDPLLDLVVGDDVVARQVPTAPICWARAGCGCPPTAMARSDPAVPAATPGLKPTLVRVVRVTAERPSALMRVVLRSETRSIGAGGAECTKAGAGAATMGRGLALIRIPAGALHPAAANATAGTTNNLIVIIQRPLHLKIPA